MSTATPTRPAATLFGRARARRTAIADGLATLAARTVCIVAGFVTSVLLARSLGPSGYGLYAQFFSLAGLTVLLVQYGMPVLLTREIAGAGDPSGDGAATVWRWSTRRSLACSVFILATLFIACGVLHRAGTIVLTPPLLAALALAASMVPAMAITRNAAGALAGLRRVWRGQAPALLVIPVTFLLGLIVLDRSGEITPGRTLAIRASAELIGMGAALILVRLHLGGAATAPSPRNVRDWDRALVPLSLMAAATTLNHHADIQMLGIIVGAEQLGVYRLASQIAVAPMIVAQIVAALTAPRAAAAHALGRAATLRPMLALGALATSAAAILFVTGIAMTGKPIVEQLFGPGFEASLEPCLILGVGVACSALFGAGVAVLNMTGSERVAARNALIACLANIGLNAMLIPWLGARGAAYATAFSLLLWQALNWWSVLHRLRLRCDIFPGA